MRDGVLFLSGELGKGLLFFRDKENGVVPEAVFPLRRVGKCAPALSAGGDHVAVGHTQCNDRDKPACPVQLSPHVLQQKAVTSHIVQSFTAVAGGIDARRSVQRVHHKPRVVGNGREPGALHDGPGLQQGVFLKGGSRLLHLHVRAHLGLQDHLHALGGQDVPHFHQLMLVFTG